MHTHFHELRSDWTLQRTLVTVAKGPGLRWWQHGKQAMQGASDQQREAVEAGRADGEVQVVDEGLGGRQRGREVVPGKRDAQRAAQRAQAVAVRLPCREVCAVHNLQGPAGAGALRMASASSLSRLSHVLYPWPLGGMPLHGMISTRNPGKRKPRILLSVRHPPAG